jgi:hypothetical protein
MILVKEVNRNPLNNDSSSRGARKPAYCNKSYSVSEAPRF